MMVVAAKLTLALPEVAQLTKVAQLTLTPTAETAVAAPFLSAPPMPSPNGRFHRSWS